MECNAGGLCFHPDHHGRRGQAPAELQQLRGGPVAGRAAGAGGEQRSAAGHTRGEGEPTAAPHAFNGGHLFLVWFWVFSRSLKKKKLSVLK